MGGVGGIRGGEKRSYVTTLTDLAHLLIVLGSLWTLFGKYPFLELLNRHSSLCVEAKVVMFS